MLIHLKEDVKLGRILNSRQLEMLSDVLNIIKEETNIEIEISNGIYEAISSKEAAAALDAAIQGYDIFVTKEEYENMIKELSDDILNQDQGFEELTCVANDMAEDILKKYNKI